MLRIRRHSTDSVGESIHFGSSDSDDEDSSDEPEYNYDVDYQLAPIPRDENLAEIAQDYISYLQSLIEPPPLEQDENPFSRLYHEEEIQTQNFYSTLDQFRNREPDRDDRDDRYADREPDRDDRDDTEPDAEVESYYTDNSDSGDSDIYSETSENMGQQEADSLFDDMTRENSLDYDNYQDSQ